MLCSLLGGQLELETLLGSGSPLGLLDCVDLGLRGLRDLWSVNGMGLDWVIGLYAIIKSSRYTQAR